MEKKQDFFFKLPPPLCKDDVPSENYTGILHCKKYPTGDDGVEKLCKV